MSFYFKNSLFCRVPNCLMWYPTHVEFLYEQLENVPFLLPLVSAFINQELLCWIQFSNIKNFGFWLITQVELLHGWLGCFLFVLCSFGCPFFISFWIDSLIPVLNCCMHRLKMLSLLLLIHLCCFWRIDSFVICSSQLSLKYSS